MGTSSHGRMPFSTPVEARRAGSTSSAEESDSASDDANSTTTTNANRHETRHDTRSTTHTHTTHEEHKQHPLDLHPHHRPGSGSNSPPPLTGFGTPLQRSLADGPTIPDDSDGDDFLESSGHSPSSPSPSLSASPPQLGAAPPLRLPDREAAAASSIAAVEPVEAFEPNDTNVPTVDICIPSFDRITNAHLGQLDFSHPTPFTLCGLPWVLFVYPLRPGGCGIYIKSMATGATFVAFRIVVFHMSVLSSAAAMSLMSSQPVGVLPASPSLPTNHRLNRTRELDEPLRMAWEEDLGWKDFLPTNHLQSYLVPAGPHTGALYVRVLMQVGPPPPTPMPTRSLGAFTSPQSTHTKQWPYVGLNNQGATCYMNSYLQTLFYLPLFRAAVYNIPIHADQMQGLLVSIDATNGNGNGISSAAAAATISNNNTAVASRGSASPSADPSMTTIAAALQLLLYQMQTSYKAIGTRALTASFGWDTASSFVQHDVQEFSRLLLENLEDASKKQTPPLPPVTRFFEGRQEMFIDCTHVKYTSSRVEPFLDLSLNVVGHPDLLSSLRDYVATETMEGANQYHAKDANVDHGKQDATKGIRILQFPPILQLQLKRFTYNMVSDRMQKVNDAFAFPPKIDLSEFEHGQAEEKKKDEARTTDNDEAAEEQKSNGGADEMHAAASSSATNPSPVDADSTSDSSSSSAPPRRPRSTSDPPIYHLHSVLVHRGHIGGGHYYVFIRPFLSDPSVSYDDSPWLKFDDETVSLCDTSVEAVEKSFGGRFVQEMRHLGHTVKREELLDANAYMLIYVRESVVRAHGMEPSDDQRDTAGDTSASGATAADDANTAASETQDVDAAMSDAAPLLPLARSPIIVSTASESAAMVVDSAPVPAADASPSPSSSQTPRHFTATPADIDAFITSLEPVPVPLPAHIAASLEEARRAKLAAIEEAKRQARLFKFRVVVERELVFHALHQPHAPGTGGVAGCGLAVAPVPDGTMLPLSRFVYTRPVHEFVYQKTDQLSSIRAEMATRFGISVERQQYWRMTFPPPSDAAARPALYLNNEHVTLETLGRESSGNAYLTKNSMPTLFLRDTLAIDHQVTISALTGAAGMMPPPGPYRSVGSLDLQPIEDRVLLMIKFFDVHTQRMYYLGSLMVFKTTSLRVLKATLFFLAHAQGIDLRQRRKEVDQIVEAQRQADAAIAPVIDEMTPLAASMAQSESHSGTAGAPPHDSTNANGAIVDADGSAAHHGTSSAEQAELTSAHPFVYPNPFPKPFPTSMPDSDVQEAYPPTFYNEEHRLEVHQQQAKSVGVKAASDDLSPVYDPFETPLSLWWEDEPIATAASSTPSAPRTYTEQLTQAEKDKASTKTPPFTFSATDYFTDVISAPWKNGTVLVMSELLTMEAREIIAQRQGQMGRTAVATPATSEGNTTATAMTTAATSIPASRTHLPGTPKRKKVVPSPAASPSRPARTLADCPPSLDLFSSSSLSLLPAPCTYHATPHSFVSALRRRLLIEFHALVLDHSTMETAPLDPVRSPLHPLVGVGPVTIEATTTMSLQHALSLLAREVASRVSPEVRAHDAQIEDVFHYKLWRALPSGRPNIADGDFMRTPITYASSIASALKTEATQSVLHDTASRSTPFTLFYEVSAVSLKTLVDHWWLNVDLVDERGRVHRRRSRATGLAEDEPFIVPKTTDASRMQEVGRRLLHDWIAPAREELGLQEYQIEMDGHILPAVPSAAPRTSKVEAMESDPPLIESKKRGGIDIVPAEGEAVKKQKVESGNAVVVSKPPPVISPNSLLHSFYTPHPLLGRANQWLLYPAHRTNPMSIFNHSWTQDSPLSAILQHSILPHWFSETSFRRAAATTVATATKGAGTAAAPFFPANFCDSRLADAATYTQPVPIRITFYIRPSGMPDLPSVRATFVFRFTAVTPLAPKGHYALSPLPPVLTFVRDSDTLASVRHRIAVQMQLPSESVRLAALRPRTYELAPDEEAQESDAFITNILNDIAHDGYMVRLALWDDETTHVGPVSATHTEKKGGEMQKNNWRRTGALTLGKA